LKFHIMSCAFNSVVTLSVSTTIFLLKYNNVLHVSTLSSHLPATLVIKIKKYTNKKHHNALGSLVVSWI